MFFPHIYKLHIILMLNRIWDIVTISLSELIEKSRFLRISPPQIIDHFGIFQIYCQIAQTKNECSWFKQILLVLFSYIWILKIHFRELFSSHTILDSFNVIWPTIILIIFILHRLRYPVHSFLSWWNRLLAPRLHNIWGKKPRWFCKNRI